VTSFVAEESAFDIKILSSLTNKKYFSTFTSNFLHRLAGEWKTQAAYMRK
jgi:hypothetical protein